MLLIVDKWLFGSGVVNVGPDFPKFGRRNKGIKREGTALVGSIMRQVDRGVGKRKLWEVTAEDVEYQKGCSRSFT